MNESVQATTELENSTSELIAFSQKKGSSFKVINENNIVEIIVPSNSFGFIFLILFWLVLPVACIWNIDLLSPDKITLTLMYLPVFYFWLRYMSKSINRVIIDQNKRLIKVLNTTLLGRFLYAKKEVSFNEISSFTYAINSTFGGRSPVRNFNTFSLNTAKRQITLIDVPCGPVCLIDPERFKAILEKLIR